MKKKTQKIIVVISAIGAIAGGLVHVLAAYNTFDLLGQLGSNAPLIQLIAGALTLVSAYFALAE